MKKQILFEVFNIVNDDINPEGIGVRVMNDHEIDATLTANILYSIYYRYLCSLDDNVQLQFAKDLKRIFNKMLAAEPSDLMIDEEQLENIDAIEDVEEDDEDED
jgi:hypothetical protein